MSERDVKGIWVPIEIWEDPHLNWFEKSLLAEIDSLDNGEGCWKTDQALAERMMCSVSHISNKIASLKAKKYLKTIRTNKHRRYLRTCFSRHGSGLSPTAESRRDLLRKVGDKIIKDDLRDNSGEYKKGSAGIFPSDSEIDPFILKCVKRYETFIRKARKISPQFKRNKWINEFRMLLQSIDGNKDRLKRVLGIYLNTPHDKYCPFASCAESFRKKFIQIERWAKEHFDGEWVDKESSRIETLPDGTIVGHFRYNLEWADEF